MERDLSQEAAERLLSGNLSSPPEGTDKLAALLAAASAPARPKELAGEAAAMAAFRARPPTVRRRSLRSALTVKVAAVVAATVAAGGVALASGTGLLPSPFQPPAESTSPSATASPSEHSPTPWPTSAGATHPATEAVTGLCHSYQAKPPSERGKALQTKPFESLVLAAGGAEHVEAYCAQLTAPPAPDKSRDVRPSRTPAAPETPAPPAAPTPQPPQDPPVTPRTNPRRGG